MSVCINCSGRVANGGDRHGKGRCNVRGRHGDRGHSLHPRRKNVVTGNLLFGNRGAAVAGTGVPKGSSKG